MLGFEEGRFMIAKSLRLGGLLLVWALLPSLVAAGDPVEYDATVGLMGGNQQAQAEAAPEPTPPPESAPKADDRSVGIVDVYSRLNVRSGPGIENAIVGKLYPGDSLDIQGERNGWLRVKHRGGTAWVCGFYVWRKGRGTRNPEIRDGIRSRFGDIPLKDRGTDLWKGEAAKFGGGASSSPAASEPVGSMPVGSRVGKRRADGGLDAPLYSQFNCGARVPSGFCGPTSIKMAMEYYGQKHHVNTCAEGVYIPGSGASHQGMLNRVKKFGMNGSYMSHGKSIAWLKQQTDAGYPLLVSVRGAYAPGKNTRGHILCIVGVTNDGRVIMNDSNGGVRRIVSGSMFRQAWHGGSGGGMAIVVKK